jgi:hypothetical protein
MKKITTINIDQATSGMELAADLLNSKNDRLFGAGTILTPTAILYIKKQSGIDKICVVEKPSDDSIPVKSKATNQAPVKSEFDLNVDKALSMVLHYDEVANIAEIIKKIHRDRSANQET